MVSRGLTNAPIFSETANWDDAQAELLAGGFGDGLPVVVPTNARMEMMLAGIADPFRSLGMLPPVQGVLTAQTVAYCCVLAGCIPAELPVVMTAAVAMLEPQFNALGIQTTTGSATVAVVVHGAAAQKLGMNAGSNCLGPGNRANACIGRAVHLVQTIIGGAKPGIGDMATMGHPGKYVFCFAEGQHPALPSLASHRGLDGGQGAVTVIGVSGTIEVIPISPGDTPESILRPAVTAMHGGRSAYDSGMQRQSTEQVILLPPETLDILMKHRWTIETVQDFIFRESPPNPAGQPWPLARSARDIVCIPTGGHGIKMTCLVPWGGQTFSVTRPVMSL